MFSTGYVAVAGCIDILLSRDCRRPSIKNRCSHYDHAYDIYY